MNGILAVWRDEIAAELDEAFEALEDARGSAIASADLVKTASADLSAVTTALEPVKGLGLPLPLTGRIEALRAARDTAAMVQIQQQNVVKNAEGRVTMLKDALYRLEAILVENEEALPAPKVQALT